MSQLTDVPAHPEYRPDPVFPGWYMTRLGDHAYVVRASHHMTSVMKFRTYPGPDDSAIDQFYVPGDRSVDEAIAELPTLLLWQRL